MRIWLCLALTLLTVAASAEDFESGLLMNWGIPGRNASGKLPEGASVRLSDAKRGEPVHGGRFALRAEAKDKPVAIAPVDRVVLADAPDGRWLVEGWLLVERGQLFTNSYNWNGDGGYVGERQWFFNAAPGWQHLRVVVGPPGSAADAPVREGAATFNWPLNVFANSVVYFDDFTIEPLDASEVKVLNPGWKRADGKAAFSVQVTLREVGACPKLPLGGPNGNTWPAEAALPELPVAPSAGVKVALRLDRQSLDAVEPAVATTDAQGVATFTVRATHSGTVHAQPYTPAPAGRPYGEPLSSRKATLTWAEPGAAVAIEDLTGHTWTPQLVQYRMAWEPGAAHPESVRAQEEAGAALATQLAEVQKHPDGSLASALVGWIASVPANGTAKYTVTAQPLKTYKPAAQPATDLKIAKGGNLEIATDKLGLRLPLAPLAAETPKTEGLPGPILAVRGRSGQWLGRGWLELPGGVTRMAPELRASGPVYADYHVEYEGPAGRYLVDVRVVAGSEVALVSEQYDTAQGAFKLSLYEGLHPDTGRWRGHSASPDFAPDYKGFFSNLEGVAPLKYDKDGGSFGLAGWMTWWPNTGFYWGVFDSKQPQGDYLGLFRARSGAWLNPAWPQVEMSKRPDLVASFGLGCGRRTWGLYSSTVAEAVPASGKSAESGLNRAMIKYGEMPLDKYKDWVLDWPGADQDAYPRMFIPPGQIEAVRQRVQTWPEAMARLGSVTAQWSRYLITGDEKLGQSLVDAEAGGDYNWMGLQRRLQWDVTEWLDGEGDCGAAMHNLHGQIKARGNAGRYDVVASVKMTPEQRRKLRALEAFEANKIADPDWIPFGTGFHLGNPNMPTAAAATLGLCGAALPSHPYAQQWMDRAYRYCRDTVNSFTAPGGAWNECPHYQMDASMTQILELAVALKNTGYADLFREPKLRDTMAYAAEISTPPDARIAARVLPSFGNTPLESTSLWGWMAAETRETDPAFAATQQWMWQESGRLLQYSYDELEIDPQGEAKAPRYTSRSFPGFGAVLRSGSPDPRETYFCLRGGYWRSHYEQSDYGNFILYAKGAPLCLDFASQYAPTVNRSYMHNRISFNHQVSGDNGSVTAFATGDRADYLRCTTTTQTLFDLPETPEEEQKLYEQRVLLPNSSPPSKQIPAATWDRRVVLLKDPDVMAPNYLVLRDSFSGNTTLPTDWNLWSLASEVKGEGNHAAATAQYGNVVLDAFMLEPAAPQWISGEWAQKFMPGNTAGLWQALHKGVAFEERQKLLRVKQGPGGGYLAVLYPRMAGEAPPQVQALEGAGAKVVTPLGTDLALLLAAAGNVTVEGTTLEGSAATVRRLNGLLCLALQEGTRLAGEGWEIAQKTAAGGVSVVAGPTLRITTSGAARPVTLTVPDAWVTATWPEQAGIKLTSRKGSVWTLEAPAGETTVEITH